MDDSSPDLSLKLRRGSSDSRDSFYMDFDKGIDSDIEEIATTSGADLCDNIATLTTATSTALTAHRDDIHSWPSIPAQNVSGGTRSSVLGGGDPLVPSPSTPHAIIVSPETLSHRSTSPTTKLTAKPSGHVQIQISPTREVSPGPMAMAPLGYYHHQQLPMARRLSRAEKQIEWRQLGADALATTLSALYGKLLVVMGTAFPMAEVISTYVPPSFYEVYYLYLYLGSMLFLFYMYIVLIRDRRKRKLEEDEKNKSAKSEGSTISNEESDNTTDSSYRPRKGSLLALPPKQNYGSFYLRMGAVAFGIGSMIYSGLEFGQYFELERNTKCHNIFLALTPATRMAFIFIQMYFIFLNNEQMRVYKHKIAARFGLMHMIGTNLSVWLLVLVQETKHEILTFYNPENNTLKISHRIPYHKQNVLGLPTVSAEHPADAHSHGHHIVARGLKGPHLLYECRRTNIIGSLVQDASPFLFPCTIEYSLICAAILYVMWRSISKLPGSASALKAKAELNYKRTPHHYSVDCSRAHKGLFVGILLLVLTIISLILFFVLISRADFVGLAVIEVNIAELTLYGLTTLATLIGMWQVRQLKYDGSRNLQLDNILLVGAQTGMFIYSTFTIIGGQFTIERNTVLVLVTALASLLQTTCQTIFVLDASRRSCATPEQIRKKPARQIVTFLLVTNLAMWAINTLEKSRAESHPIQLHFYGLWAWTIITHVSMPLAIFYRFHSTVCLCEIWKRAYKMKPAYM
ncbi:PREDICTED: otopetrin-2-like isoform X2 [Nicrophorus vespilloides]|uniref:Otopetrin-2-like isoform X2 n=1 Tax=Nicrophorus vespilloides TaxID=110193 RepID=A0ABM1NHB1_NICVS|nr:PREDICTED: otopetrin-2-like isoform X2 [Nicrophorus vespilloides]